MGLFRRKMVIDLWINLNYLKEKKHILFLYYLILRDARREVPKIVTIRVDGKIWSDYTRPTGVVWQIHPWVYPMVDPSVRLIGPLHNVSMEFRLIYPPMIL
jgi:hypothetical protein